MGALTAAFPVSLCKAQSSFRGIGALPPFSDSAAYGISADGTTVVGMSAAFPIRWTAETGIRRLGEGTGVTGRANAASGNGAVIVGQVYDPLSFVNRAFRWTSIDGLQYLNVPSGWHFANAEGISAAGDVIVGQGSNGAGTGLRWTALGITVVGGGWNSSDASGVSADGSVVAGRYQPASYYRALRWTGASGTEDLGSLGQSSALDAIAFAVSGDGSVIVGIARTPINVYRAFRWTQGSGMVDLGLPNSVESNYVSATAVSYDGTVVVGFVNNDSGDRAFVWTQANGMRLLRDHLVEGHGLDVRGWCLRQATGVSADGRDIVGVGTNPAGVGEGWVAHIASPLSVPACDADWNRDGFVSGEDFDEFVAEFVAGGRPADFDGDCFVSGTDFDDFVAAFTAGC